MVLLVNILFVCDVIEWLVPLTLLFRPTLAVALPRLACRRRSDGDDANIIDRRVGDPIFVLLLLLLFG